MRPLTRLTGQTVALRRIKTNCTTCRQRQLLHHDSRRFERSLHTSFPTSITAGPSTHRRHGVSDDEGPVIALGRSPPERDPDLLEEQDLQSSTPAEPGSARTGPDAAVDISTALGSRNTKSDGSDDTQSNVKVPSERILSPSQPHRKDTSTSTPVSTQSTSIPLEWRKTLENHFKRLTRESEKKLTEVGLKINEVTGYDEVERLKDVVANAGEWANLPVKSLSHAFHTSLPVKRLRRFQLHPPVLTRADFC